MSTTNRKKLKERVENGFKFFFLGYGWKAFLFRLCAVVISLKLNSLDDATNQFTTGAMKLFLLTCAFLAYAIFMLIFDYSKRGIEVEKRKKEEGKQ